MTTPWRRKGDTITIFRGLRAKADAGKKLIQEDKWDEARVKLQEIIDMATTLRDNI